MIAARAADDEVADRLRLRFDPGSQGRLVSLLREEQGGEREHQSCFAIQSSSTGAMRVRHLLPWKMP